MGGFGRCTAFAGDQRLRANLRRLHAVIRIGGAGGWMNGFDHRGQNLYAAVECLQIGLHGSTDLFGQPYPVFTEQSVEGA
ncbi:hypothetical protein D3C75_1249580 [compost metagenome]